MNVYVALLHFKTFGRIKKLRSIKAQRRWERKRWSIIQLKDIAPIQEDKMYVSVFLTLLTGSE